MRSEIRALAIRAAGEASFLLGEVPDRLQPRGAGMKSRHVQPKRVRAFRCRCSGCDHRIFMERHPDSYTRGLECASCGRNDRDRSKVWRVDWYRTSKAESRRRGVCHCAAAPFPHRPDCGLLVPVTRRHFARKACWQVAA